MIEVHDHDGKKVDGKSPIVARLDTEKECVDYIKKVHRGQKVTLDAPPFGPGKLVSIDGNYRYFVGSDEKFKPEPDAGITLHVPCIKCPKITPVVMTQEQAIAYGNPERGAVAAIFPNQSVETQRLLSVGICPKCW
jgi:hypothetical protein